MESHATHDKPRAPALVPAFNAFAVTPVVGGIVLLLLAVGTVAVTIGALSSIVGYRIRRHDPARRAD